VTEYNKYIDCMTTVKVKAKVKNRRSVFRRSTEKHMGL